MPVLILPHEKVTLIGAFATHFQMLVFSLFVYFLFVCLFVMFLVYYQNYGECGGMSKKSLFINTGQLRSSGTAAHSFRKRK